jgi:Ran GTPase-activating protein (RanGAP) involved in mRNA processing and transport
LSNLKIAKNNLEVDGITALCSSFKIMLSLTNLNLSIALNFLIIKDNCGLTEQGGLILAQVLSEMISLRAISIGKNALTAKSAVEIIKSIKDLHNIQEIDFSENAIEDEAISYLIEEFKLSTSLRMLDLSIFL